MNPRQQNLPIFFSDLHNFCHSTEVFGINLWMAAYHHS